MQRLKYLFILPLFLFTKTANAQNACSALGQTPSTAFPVCGLDTFTQGSVPVCSGNSLSVPGCGGAPYSDVNPFWYRFTCYTSGTLEFKIGPEDLNDDYDWQVFDVTGASPNDVYFNSALAVVGNWSGNSSLESARGYTGITGTSPDAANSFECASNPPELGQQGPYSDVSTFSKPPVLQQGHTYLLMVSHFSGTNQSGYKLYFTGGTASIVDPLTPAMLYIDASCDRQQLYLKMNKRIKCSSLSSNGSEFTIPSTSLKITSATGVGCDSSFDMDSIVVNLQSPLPPGEYDLVIQPGGDENTLLDNCDNAVPDKSSIHFTLHGLEPTPMDSLVPVACAPQLLQLHFVKNIQCSTVASNGSDFKVTGPFPVTIAGASGNSCVNGLSKIIDIRLAAPIVHAGTYTIQLNTGSDGNAIIDECSEETPAGSAISFTVNDTVSANFTYNIIEGCRSDEIHYFNNGGSSITQWLWTFDSTITSTQQNPVITYNTFGGKNAQLIVTNGFCTDTTRQNFNLNHDSLVANFTGPDFYCPNDLAYFKDTSIGTIIAWNWLFGNGKTSDQKIPPPQYYSITEKERVFPIRLIIESNKFCYDTAMKYLKVVNNCYIAVPSAFTPNGDGKNDYLYPINAFKATRLEFRVFNKYGQQLFETKDWTHKWDGTFNGQAQASGVYVWMLEYSDVETGKKVFQKGTTVLIR
jgi:gliding motility-associated-like protein